MLRFTVPPDELTESLSALVNAPTVVSHRMKLADGSHATFEGFLRLSRAQPNQVYFEGRAVRRLELVKVEQKERLNGKREPSGAA